MSLKPKLLLINGRFLEQPVTGVQRYSLELLRALDDLLDSGGLDQHCYQPVCLVSSAVRAVPHWKHIPVQKIGHLKGNLWEQFELLLTAYGHQMFSPANVGPYFLPGQVVTIHDASVFAIPEAYSLKFRWKHRMIFRRMAKTARTILTVSEFSKRELVRWCSIPQDKIQVIPEGREHILRMVPDLSIFERLHIGSKPYFLCVGSNSPHKNFDVVLEAVARLNQHNFEVIIAGGDFYNVFQAQVHGLDDNVRWQGYLKDGELRALYQRAIGFIFPSLYEGFGLPPLEAMSCGCPVICSNAASIPEVGGDAVLYFNPSDAGELAQQMQRLAADPALQAALREKGTRRAEQFSWEQTARATWEALCQR